MFLFEKNKQKSFFLMFQGSLNPKIRLLGQNVCHVARTRTHKQSDHFQAFMIFFIQSIIKQGSARGLR